MSSGPSEDLARAPARPQFDLTRGLEALGVAVLEILLPAPVPAAAVRAGGGMLLADSAVGLRPGRAAATPERGSGRRAGDEDHEDDAEGLRLVALVDLARAGDKDAFGLLYDHYHPSVFRFVYYRTQSTTLAEDLTAETFFRALRNIDGFRWQGRDFGAWLTTIARNLVTDHFKAGRTRLEQATDDIGGHETAGRRDDALSPESPETLVLRSLTHEALLTALARLPRVQQDCLVMRFLQGLSIAETARVLQKSEGAVKQLQLRAVRHLAKLLPDGLEPR